MAKPKTVLNEVAEQIRYACPGAVVGIRISNQEYFEGGLTKEEMIDLSQDLEARGLDFIHLSAGGGYEEAGHLVPVDLDVERHVVLPRDLGRVIHRLASTGIEPPAPANGSALAEDRRRDLGEAVRSVA